MMRVTKPDGDAQASPSASVWPLRPKSRTLARSNSCVAMPRVTEGHCTGSQKKQCASSPKSHLRP